MSTCDLTFSLTRRCLQHPCLLCWHSVLCVGLHKVGQLDCVGLQKLFFKWMYLRPEMEIRLTAGYQPLWCATVQLGADVAPVLPVCRLHTRTVACRNWIRVYVKKGRNVVPGALVHHLHITVRMWFFRGGWDCCPCATCSLAFFDSSCCF